MQAVPNGTEIFTKYLDHLHTVFKLCMQAYFSNQGKHINAPESASGIESSRNGLQMCEWQDKKKFIAALQDIVCKYIGVK